MRHVASRTILIAVLLIAGVGTVRVAAQNVTQSYQSDITLQNGEIVRLTEKAGNKVEPLTAAKQTDMLGVVVAPTDSPVLLSNNGDQTQVYVATFGQYDVLVSNQNGPVNIGDYLTISSIDGVGMKAGKQQLIILGKALKSFSGQNPESTTTLVDSAGVKKTVGLARIPVDISVAHNPLYQPDNPNGVPHWLSRVAQVVTNKPIGAVRIYAGLIVLLMAVLLAGTLLVAGVRSSMAAVGRNPLAKKFIMRNLLQVVLLALILVAAGVFAVYLLLKL